MAVDRPEAGLWKNSSAEVPIGWREPLAGNPQGPRWLQCGLLYCGMRRPSLFITEIDQRAMEAPDPIDLASSAMGCGDGQKAQKFFYVEQ
jgi:hypothetical protein